MSQRHFYIIVLFKIQPMAFCTDWLTMLAELDAVAALTAPRLADPRMWTIAEETSSRAWTKTSQSLRPGLLALTWATAFPMTLDKELTLVGPLVTNWLTADDTRLPAFALFSLEAAALA